MGWLIDLWRKIPLKITLAIVIACLLIGEQFPFSDFPMFGSFVGKTYYLYLADEQGRPIAAKTFGVPTNGIKKFYDGRLRKLKKDRKGLRIETMDDSEVARETLRYLISKREKNLAHLSALRLMRVDVSIRDNQVVKAARVTAELPIK